MPRHVVPAGSLVAVLAAALALPLTAVRAAGPPSTAPVTASGGVVYHGTLLAHEPAARPANASIPEPGPKPEYQVAFTGWMAGEPTIGVDHHGVAWVDGGDWLSAGPLTLDQWPEVHTSLGSASTQTRRAQFLASSDGGSSWHVDQSSLLAGTGDGHPWFFDPYTYVDRDTGRVFEGTLTDAAGSYFEFSDDQGQTWTRANMYVPGINDHETVFAGPVPAGSGLVASDPVFPKIVYYCVNQLVDAACARSSDGGRTFLPTASFAYQPDNPTGPAGVSGCEGLNGHGNADAQGRIFLPWPCQQPWIVISTDAASTWTTVPVDPGSDIGVAPRAGTTSVAVDRDGNLYYAWWDQRWFMPYLAISRDHGATWSTPRMIAPPGVAETNFAAINVGDPGRVAIQFVGTADGDQSHADRPWNHYTVISTNALSADPTFVATVTNPGGPAVPIHRGACQGPCAGMLDYLGEPAVDDSGRVWAAAVSTCMPDNGCTSPGGTGAEATAEQGFVVHQVAGPSLYAHPSHALAPLVAASVQAAQTRPAATALPDTRAAAGAGATTLLGGIALAIALASARRRRRRPPGERMAFRRRPAGRDDGLPSAILGRSKQPPSRISRR